MYASSLFVAAMLVSSCLKENTDNCPPEEITNPGSGDRQIRVFFTYGDDLRGEGMISSSGYTVPDSSAPIADAPKAVHGSTRALTPDDVHYIDLFLFNEDGIYLETVERDHPVMSADYYIPLTLSAGTYHLVTWVNLRDEYELSADRMVPGETRLDELVLSLMLEGDTLTSLSHHLFFGRVSSIAISESEDHDFYIPLVRNTYEINLDTRGFPRTGYTYEMLIDDPHYTFDFENRLISGPQVCYKNICTSDESWQLHGSITVLGLSEDRPDQILSLKRSGDGHLLFEGNLVELILGLRRLGLTVDFSRIFVYDILLIFNERMEVTVNINGWNVIEDGVAISI